MYLDKQFVLVPLGIYVVWMLSTYMLEGRINLLHKPDILGRCTYAIIANIIPGNIVAIYVLRRIIKSKISSLNRLGFRSMSNSLTMAAIAVLVGSVLFVVQQPSSLNPIIIMNIFAQTLPTSIAEIIVCWVRVGVSFESFLYKNTANHVSKSNKIIYAIVAAVIATILFGLDHFVHTEPFNQLGMVLVLMFPGALTSAFYFIGRDIYATIIITFKYCTKLWKIQIIVSILVLIILDVIIIRKTIESNFLNNQS